ncbi:GAF domain-containing sensor histidine kinase [Flagellimonas crocea]|uniref:GAF domain-containing sensor histidine kinase n=1 Tax=Flagellimonas crocea TaxID=3067311 RepID=UPI00296E3033|nr:GAF domain-containing sensor histidine kinase [Muricauda sp. DH64]
MMQKDTMNALEEYKRVKKLNELDLDYSQLQSEFQRLVQLAAHITDTDISFINLIDTYSQWTVASSDANLSQIDREDSVCQYTILDEKMMEVPHLDQDKRFRDKSFVKNDGFKYYLGIPLKVSTGENIGALCVIDHGEKNISLEKKELLQLIADEIVEKLENLKRLEKLEDELSKAIKERYQMAHDIRSPLGGILGLTTNIDEEMDSEESKMYFNMINRSVSKLMDLTDDILEKRKNIQEQNYFNLSSLKEHLDALYLVPARNKEIQLQISFDSTKDDFQFSRRKLLPIFGNLIANAIKFTPAHGEITVTLDIVEKGEISFLKVKVSDNGMGMSKEKLEDLKNEAIKSNQGTDGEKGYGLGLQLVAEMVNSVNGRLHIDSKKDVGTSIEVEMPI